MATTTKTTVPSIQWRGQSGGTYTYHIFPRGTEFTPGQAGNYIYSRLTEQGWVPVYIGQTGDLNDRLSDHEKETCVDRNGATHIHAKLTTGGSQVRRAEEMDLIHYWQPTCNVVGIR